ncbi:phage recombination protein Bet [Paraferrimonas sedimenticola]|uniref:Phage recombination protein Bet n=1 Tax=Paraferrimonas sedimenticola TaxID=375674 RepID=A0AA37W0Q3_9GAMM|nr:phage recombination protein Bet [Paraferrimonas sedimenticola]GLP95322.1 phage recombination protein Bet [Paraferrimonas sedimenticola]
MSAAQNNKVVSLWKDEPANQPLVSRGLDESGWNALCTSIFPGASHDSILLAVDYCRAREMDIMMKPVHIVPMYIKDAQTNQKGYRDVIMPGVGMYRIQAARSGDYAGADQPQFGPTITEEFTDKQGKPVTVSYPEWACYTVYKLVGGSRVPFSATEFWRENYATMGATNCPNAMWQKRPAGQLLKCAESQALRRAWPEIGQQPTYEEMEGKTYHEEKEINPAPKTKLDEVVADANEAANVENEQSVMDLAFRISESESQKELANVGLEIKKLKEAGKLSAADLTKLQKAYQSRLITMKG